MARSSFAGALMMTTRVKYFVPLLITALACWSSSLADADQVDDLLAGKPIKIEEVAAEEAVAPAINERIIVPVEKTTLADERWEVAESHSVSGSNPALDRSAPRPIATTVVPEPSAIALAALSLVYFLLFFRRRYSL
jgi:hypothetical protein